MDQKNTDKKITEFEAKGQTKIKRKERAVVTVSAVFILTALTLTGMYINNNMADKTPNTEQVKNVEQLPPQSSVTTPQSEDLQSVDSTTVENPGIVKNTIVAEDIKTPASQSSNALRGETITNPNVDIALESTISEELLGAEGLSEEMMMSEIQNSMLGFSGMNMMWPVSEANDVIIPYSMDKVVYFKTLDQYKYNPATIISAETGTPVHAVSAGRITRRYWDFETGWTYEMDLGGGFKAYYGQLENLQKAEDTYVAAGDILGYVANPTKYYLEEGSNLYFAMTRDGKPVYPKDYMGE